MGLWFWLITVPFSWATGFAVQRLTVSMGADGPSSISLDLLAFAVVAVFTQDLIDTIAAHRRNT